MTTKTLQSDDLSVHGKHRTDVPLPNTIINDILRQLVFIILINIGHGVQLGVENLINWHVCFSVLAVLWPGISPSAVWSFNPDITWIKINIIPFKSQQFAQAHPWPCGHKEERIIIWKMNLTIIKKQVKLILGKKFIFWNGFLFGPVFRKQPFCNAGSWVCLNQFLIKRIIQHPGYDILNQ